VPEYAADLGLIGDEAAVELPVQLRIIDSIGWAGIELRSIGGRMIADLHDDEFASALAMIADSRVNVLSLASNIGGWGRSINSDFREDLHELERLAPRALALDTKRIRIMSWQNDGCSQAEWRRAAQHRIAAITRRAETLGVALAHENCAGWGGQGPQQALQLLDHAASKSLALLFDTGNGLTYGYDARAYLEPLSHAVAHVHIKDGCVKRKRVRYVQPGYGDAGVMQCVQLLVDAGYRGPWVLEPHFLIAPHAGCLTASPSASRNPLRLAAHAFEVLLEEINTAHLAEAQS
jgi:L-ribulose-5-phosphate 3-epimerase